MRKRSWTVVAATVGATLAIGVPVAISAGSEAGVKTTITLGAVGYQGKVSASSPECVGERIVVLKQKGNGVLSRVTSKSNGSWKADLDELNKNIEIPAMVFAEAKPSSPPGPVANCLGAVSKTVEIAGG